MNNSPFQLYTAHMLKKPNYSCKIQDSEASNSLFDSYWALTDYGLNTI